MPVAIGTHYVVADEPCWGLFELNQQAPNGGGLRRYQIIQVIRHEDKIAEYRRDLGPAGSFKAEQFRIPGGGIDPETGRIWIEETVGRLMDIADTMRAQPKPDVAGPLTQKNGSLFERYARHVEKAKAASRN